mgnify:CR=1 FL=1
MVKGRIIFGISGLLILLGSFLTGCEEDKTNLVYELNDPDSLATEVYEVYSKVIDHQFGAQEYIVLQQETDTSVHKEHCYDLYESNTTDLDTTTVGNYLPKNQQSYNLGASFDTDAMVKPVTRKELNSYKLNSDEGWESFHNNNPEAKGVLYFTLPGFNEEHTKGLFEYTWHTGMKESEHYLVYLRKKEGEWHMIVHENIDVQSYSFRNLPLYN